jgi:hypothetical protein
MFFPPVPALPRVLAAGHQQLSPPTGGEEDEVATAMAGSRWPPPRQWFRAGGRRAGERANRKRVEERRRFGGIEGGCDRHGREEEVAAPGGSHGRAEEGSRSGHVRQNLHQIRAQQIRGVKSSSRKVEDSCGRAASFSSHQQPSRGIGGGRERADGWGGSSGNEGALENSRG